MPVPKAFENASLAANLFAKQLNFFVLLHFYNFFLAKYS